MSNWIGPPQPDTSDFTAAVEFLRRERAQDVALDSPEWLTSLCKELITRGYKRINDPRQERST